MKNFINFIIKALIRIVVFLAVLLLCGVLYVVYISYTNNVEIDDTMYYIKSIGNDIINNYDNNPPINITLDDNVNSEENINISSSNKTNFYYKQLDDTAKIIYNSLENNIDNFKKENYTIDFSTKFNDLLHKSTGKNELNKSFQSALDAFFYDHPELFYIDLTKISLVINYTTFGSHTTYKVSLEPENNINYLSDGFNSESEVNQAISNIENIRNNIIKTIPKNTSNYNKALAVHDYLVKYLEYDSTTTRTNTHNIYGSFIDKKVVCEGYAKAFKYILDSLNIECILVSGTATNSTGETESHMWNYINLNGNWYGVDVTWDDPIIIGNSTNKIVRHNYFCKGNEVFKESHVVNRKLSDTGMIFTIPKLSTTSYNK